MVIDQHDDDKCGETRTDRIARQAQDAGEAATRRTVAARRRGQAAGKRAAELREWGGYSPGGSREAADRAASAATAARAAGWTVDRRAKLGDSVVDALDQDIEIVHRPRVGVDPERDLVVGEDGDTDGVLGRTASGVER